MAENKKFNHLTKEERIEIQECLNHGMDFKKIARRIGKNQTTISREVKRHIEVVPARSSAEADKVCELLLKAPFVCNGCARRSRCMKERRMYYALKADTGYREALSESRSGIALNRKEFYEQDAVLKAGVEKGQHIYHIIKSNPQIMASTSTVYRYIKKGYSSVSVLDLPRLVSFKPRKTKSVEGIPTRVRQGRTFECFQDFLANHDLENWLEMDTVIGRPGGKVLVTFCTSYPPFMFGRLAADKTAASVSSEIQKLKSRLSASGFNFGDIFPVVLTDNGGEFANAAAVEQSASGEQESRLFFCDPYCSSQKPHVEKGHTLLRDILPKGSSFDALTQDDVDLIFSHINGVLRKELRGRSAFDVFAFLYSERLAAALGIHFVDPDDVVQSPDLLK